MQMGACCDVHACSHGEHVVQPCYSSSPGLEESGCLQDTEHASAAGSSEFVNVDGEVGLVAVRFSQGTATAAVGDAHIGAGVALGRVEVQDLLVGARSSALGFLARSFQPGANCRWTRTYVLAWRWGAWRCKPYSWALAALLRASWLSPPGQAGFSSMLQAVQYPLQLAGKHNRCRACPGRSVAGLSQREC